MQYDLSKATNAHYRDHINRWKRAHKFYHIHDPREWISRDHDELKSDYQLRKEEAYADNYTNQIISRITNPITLRMSEVERDLSGAGIPSSYLDAAGPKGESHDQQMKRLADYLMLFGEAWLQVRPFRGDAVLEVLTPIAVPRYTDQRVMVKGERKTNEFPDKESTTTSYTIHTGRKYETYVKGEQGWVSTGDGDVYHDDGHYFIDTFGDEAAPFVHVQLPGPALGPVVATTHRAMHRLANRILGRTNKSLSAGKVIYGGLDDEGEKRVQDAYINGENLLFVDLDAEVEEVDVPIDGVPEARALMKDMEERLYKTANQTLQETANSATEAHHQNQSTAAAIASLASTLQSAEESALSLVAQALDMPKYAGPNPSPTEIRYNVKWSDISWDAPRLPEDDDDGVAEG